MSNFYKHRHELFEMKIGVALARLQQGKPEDAEETLRYALMHDKEVYGEHVEMGVADALETVKRALRDDPSYAHTWHCNLAMSFSDAIPEALEMQHEDLCAIRNEGASRFMKLCFDVETSNDMLEGVS